MLLSDQIALDGHNGEGEGEERVKERVEDKAKVSAAGLKLIQSLTLTRASMANRRRQVRSMVSRKVQGNWKRVRWSSGMVMSLVKLMEEGVSKKASSSKTAMLTFSRLGLERNTQSESEKGPGGTKLSVVLHLNKLGIVEPIDDESGLVMLVVDGSEVLGVF